MATIYLRGYLFRSGTPNRLWFSGPADEAMVGDGFHCDSLLHETVEELSAALRSSTVESEREFVEVVLEMFMADGTLMGSQQPALE